MSKHIQSDKPIAKMVGQNGNVFNLIGIAQRALNKVGKKVEADEMVERVFKSHSYDEALRIMGEYVLIV